MCLLNIRTWLMAVIINSFLSLSRWHLLYKLLIGDFFYGKNWILRPAPFSIVGVEQVTSHYLNQCWPSSLKDICSTMGRCIENITKCLLHCFTKGWRNWYRVWGHGCDTTDSQMSPQPRRSRGCGDIWESVVSQPWPKTRYQFLFYHGTTKLTLN